MRTLFIKAGSRASIYTWEKYRQQKQAVRHRVVSSRVLSHRVVGFKDGSKTMIGIKDSSKTAVRKSDPDRHIYYPLHLPAVRTLDVELALEKMV